MKWVSLQLAVPPSLSLWRPSHENSSLFSSLFGFVSTFHLFSFSTGFVFLLFILFLGVFFSIDSCCCVIGY